MRVTAEVVGRPESRRTTQISTAAELFVSREGNDANSGSYAAPVASVDRALAMAASRGLRSVRVLAGEYPGQALVGRKFGVPVKVRPADGPVSFPFSTAGCSGLDIEGFACTQIRPKSSQHLRIADCDVSLGNLQLRQCEDCLVEDNYVHDILPNAVPAPQGILIWNYNGLPSLRIHVRRNLLERMAGTAFSLSGSSDLLIEENTAREIVPGATSNHTDVAFLGGSGKVTIRRNVMLGVAHGVVASKNDSVDVTVEDNLFVVRYGYAINGTFGPNAKILRNTLISRYGLNLFDFTGDAQFPNDPAVLENAQVLGNVFQVETGWGKGGLGLTPTEDYNLWPARDPSKTYGPHDVFGKPVFNPDWSLADGSPGKGAGPQGQDLGADVKLLEGLI